MHLYNLLGLGFIGLRDNYIIRTQSTHTGICLGPGYILYRYYGPLEKLGIALLLLLLWIRMGSIRETPYCRVARSPPTP